jgi:hypothetical protein
LIRKHGRNGIVLHLTMHVIPQMPTMIKRLGMMKHP